jgi:hypothetical protein
MGATRYSSYLLKCTLLVAPMVGIQAACAAPNIEATAQHRMDCRHYQEQEQTSLEALKRADPAIRGEWLDSVFYSPKQNSCLATVSFTKRGTTYSGIFDISDSRAVWMRAYRGRTFTPAHIVAMDWDLYEKVEELEFAPAQ